MMNDKKAITNYNLSTIFLYSSDVDLNLSSKSSSAPLTVTCLGNNLSKLNSIFKSSLSIVIHSTNDITSSILNPF